jgi:hypothetical protein
MLDDLRNSSSFIDEEEPPEEQSGRYRTSRGRSKGHFLGMTAQQRFIISVMLFLMVCVLGSFALILSGSVVVF